MILLSIWHGRVLRIEIGTLLRSTLLSIWLESVIFRRRKAKHVDYEVRVRLQITFNTLLQDIYSYRDHSHWYEQPYRIELAEKIRVNESVR